MTFEKKLCPNFDDKSYRKPIDRIVIHWIGVGTLESANNRFQNPSAKASAHYGVSDDRVIQWVEEDCVAWHAGGFEINSRSIGIEHDATTLKKATDLTYETSADLIKSICKRHNIPLDREHIIGHNEVSPTQCPGTIDITRLIELAKRETPNEIEELKKELSEMRESRNKWRTDYKQLEKLYKDQIAQNNAMDQTLAEQVKLIAEKDEKIKKYEAALVTNKTPLEKFSTKELVDDLVRRFKGVF